MLKYLPPKSKGISSALLSGMSAKEKDSYKDTFRNSTYVLDPIRAAILSKLNSSLMPPKADYEAASWGEKQADRLGYIRALQEVLKLLH